MSNKKAIKLPEPESVKTPIVNDEVKSQLPEPKGWKILIAMRKKKLKAVLLKHPQQ